MGLSPQLTHQDRGGRNGENRSKWGIAARFRVVQLSPRANEKERGMDPLCPYLDPTQVFLGEKP